MAFPKSVPTSWVVRSVASEDTLLSNLKPFEFGIFDEDTHKALSSASTNKRRRVYFGCGSPNQKQFNQGSKPERLFNLNNADVTFRSELVPTSKVDIVRYQEPKRVEKPNVYYLGYSGVASGICKTLKFECGKNYKFNVEVKGRPVRNIFPGEMRELIEFSTDCCDDCGQTGCETGEDCHKYIDDLVDRFNNGLWVSRFFTASKVITCADDLPGLTTTTFNKFILTVCDNGDEIALSNVQNQYPDLKVEKIKREAPYTTYQVITTGGAPSAFTQTNLIFEDECGECPSGFTSVPGGNAYIVEITSAVWDDNFLTDDNTTVSLLLDAFTANTNTTAVSVSADKLVFYVVTSDVIDVTAVVAHGVSTLSLGSVKDTCSGGTTTTDWLSNGTCYKVQRDLCVIVGSDNCDDPSGTQAALLDEATEFYNQLDEVVTDSLEFGGDNDTDGCTMQLTLSQYNNAFLEDDCDTAPQPVFDVLPPFKGNIWTICNCEGWTVNEDTGCPVPPVADENCCQCGIKFVTKPTTELLDTFAGYDFATYLEKEPVELVVTVYRDDAETRICNYDSPTWLHAQRATFRQLRGDDVIKRIITERFYNQEPWVNQVNKENLLFLQREGIKLGVVLEDFYYAIDVYFNEERNQNNTASHNNTRHCVTLFVNENDTVALANLRSQLALAFPEAKLENWI